MSDDYELNIDQDSIGSSHKPNSGARASNLWYAIPRKARIVGIMVAVTCIIISLLIAFQPQAKKRPIPETVVRVDVVEANRSSYPIVVTASGTIEAETRGNLVAQISGEITRMSENFKAGGTFKKNDVLITIDKRDYQAELSQTMAMLSQADAAYRQEQATAKQAELDWKRLGNTKPAPDLVLRKPQLAAAQAQLESARAATETAKLNLGRTTLTAPYDGRIIQRQAVLGQYVSIGTPIAEVFSTDGVEVRLPLSQEEFNQLGLNQLSAETEPGENKYKVVVTSTVGNVEQHWQAEITRTDSTYDINTRQIDVIGKVIDPFGKVSGQLPLKIGQFISARIEGRMVDDVFVIPNKSIREGSYIYAVRDNKLTKLNIDIVWQDDQNALVSNGINDAELVVTTSLNSTLAGATAKLSEQQPNGDAPTSSPTDEQTSAADTQAIPADDQQPATSGALNDGAKKAAASAN